MCAADAWSVPSPSPINRFQYPIPCLRPQEPQLPLLRQVPEQPDTSPSPRPPSSLRPRVQRTMGLGKGERAAYPRVGAESEEISTTVQFSAKPETERRWKFLSWWGKVDSNHRSRRQQIYSMPHLTALEFPHMKFYDKTRGCFQTEPVPSSSLRRESSEASRGESEEIITIVQFSPPGGNGTVAKISKLELVDGFEPPTC